MSCEQVSFPWGSRSSALLLAVTFLFGFAVVPLTQCAQETWEYAQGERAIWMSQALHLVGLEEQGLLLDDPQAVVYVWSMRDNAWTPEARLRPGDEITLRLRSWDDVADRLDGINRSELDVFTLQLVEPAWGEVMR